MAFAEESKVEVNGSALGMIVGTSVLGALGIICRPDCASEFAGFGVCFGGLVGGTVT